MFSFKLYLKENNPVFGYADLILHEELTDKQKEKVDDWGDGSRGRELSSHVFPKGQDRIEIPFNMIETPVVPHPDVKKHLENNGYQISDYKSGFANDKYGRSVSIGKILNKTKAPQDIVSSFINDPQRAASTVEKPKIIFSRHPYDVAGMSTDRGWRSCMTMGSGCNQHYLEDDIKQGTHVAYLVRPGDDDIKKPMARIALKPFRADEQLSGFATDGHTILRPESSVYGIGKNRNFDENDASGVDSDIINSFKHSVRDWTARNFPMKENTVYRKHEDVYDDDGKRVIMPFDKQIAHTNSQYVVGAFHDHPDKITPEHIEKALNGTLNGNSDGVVTAAINHPLATPEQILKASKMDSYRIQSAALKDRRLPESRLEDVLLNHTYGEDLRLAALKNPNVSSKVLDSMISDKNDYLREDALGHPNVSGDTLLNLAKSNDYKDSRIKMKAIKHPNFKAQHIDAALDDMFSPSLIKEKLLENPNINSKHLSKIINGDQFSASLKRQAVSHPKASSKDLEDYFNNSKALGADKAMVLQESPKITSEIVDKILSKPAKNQDERDMQYGAVYHDKASKETLENVINTFDKNDDIRSRAFHHKNVKSELLDRALRDPTESDYTRAMAARNENTSSQALMDVLKGNNHYVAISSFDNPKISEKHIDAAMSNPVPTIRLAALQSDHKAITKDHVINALGDPNIDVARYARHEMMYKLNGDDLVRAMSHPNVEVRRNATYHSNLSREAHALAVNDEDAQVRASAFLHRYTTPSQIDKATNDPDHSVRIISTLSQHITPEHLTKLSNDPEHSVRMAVAMNKKTPPDILNHLAQNDPHEKVREEATKNLTPK